ncbi:MAG: YceI family protein [Planctomycetes bacterium]|nr:YceI family protein [Planctomycetota bacterium]
MGGKKGFECFLWAIAAVSAIGISRGQAAEFDFDDPKGVNSMVFVLDSPLEPIMGLANSISGTVEFDPAQPEKMSGTIKVAAKSVKTSNKKMNEYLHGRDWLNVKKFKSIDFAIKSVTVDSKPEKDVFDLTITGDFTLHGVTKELSVPVKVSYLPNKLGDRMRGKPGDLLVLRSQFSINRKDFGIKKGMSGVTVAEEIEIRISMVGSHFK